MLNYYRKIFFAFNRCVSVRIEATYVNTPSFPKCLTPLTFFNMFDHSSYSKTFVKYVKTFVKYVKLYVYIKVYLTMNRMVGKELIRRTVKHV